jgi:hypothetical protein
MIKKLERDEIAADLATVNSILETIPDDDVLGRVGFEARRDTLTQSLSELDVLPEIHAEAALVFAGDPVRGATGMRSDFAGGALTRYQDAEAQVRGILDVGPVADFERLTSPHMPEANGPRAPS